MGNRLNSGWKSTPHATIHPTPRDLEWAAGFLEGEGYFSFRPDKRKFGEHVAATQVQRHPLERLQALFGGSVKSIKGGRKRGDIFRWAVNGARARGIMMTLYSLVSPKRKQQIEEALLRYDA